MAENGSNNWLWWTIGGVATLGLGIGVYYFVKANKDAKAEDEKKKSEDKVITPPVTIYTNPTPAPSPSPSPAPVETYPLKSTPFTSVEQSNAFRAWVNAKDPAFAKEIDLSPSSTSANSINNEYIQKAWGKYSQDFYTTNALALGYGTRLATGANAIEGGIKWSSVNANPRGEITMYTDGKITANAVNAQGAQTKFVQGGWYISGVTFHLMIGGENYNVGVFNLQNAFWSILKKATIFNSSNNSYSAFNANGNMGAKKFGYPTDGTKLQDVML
jgi:hypothetical protein